MKPSVAKSPRKVYAMDTLSYRGYAVTTIVDLFTKWAHAKVHEGASAARGGTKPTAAMSKIALAEAIERGGKPASVRVDGGREFRGDFETFLDVKSIQKITSRPAAPMSNGAVEAMNGKLRKMMESHQIERGSTVQEALCPFRVVLPYSRCCG